jgi:class 3 adenylate cyclase
VLQGSSSLCLVAFGLPQTLEQLPQRAVQAALAIRHLVAEVQDSAGHAAGPVVRLAGHLGTLLVAEEADAMPGRWLAVGETLSLPVRLLGHAAPGELLMSSPIARLTHDWVDMQVCPRPSENELAAPSSRTAWEGSCQRRVCRCGERRRLAARSWGGCVS